MTDAGRAADEDVARPRRLARFPDDADPLYTVGQVADMLGVQAAFLRRLDSQGVVTPGRSPGGQRRYSRNEIDRIVAITGLLDENMTLAGANRIIALQAEIIALRVQLAESESLSSADDEEGTAPR